MDLSDIERIARVGTWDFDPRSGELIWSELQYRIMGVPEGFEPTCEDYLAIVHPDDRTRTERAIKQSLATGDEYTVVHRIAREGSSPGMVLCRGTVEFGSDGRPVRMAGVSVDLTDLHKSSEAHRAKHDLLEIAEELTGVGSFVWEIENGQIASSDNMQRILGLEAGRFGGTIEDYMALVHPDDRSERRRRLDELLAEGDTDMDMATYRIVRPTGEVRRLQSRVQLTRDQNGKPTHMIGAVRDMTEWPGVPEAG